MSMIVVLVVIALVVLFLVSTYNGLVTSRNAFKNASRRSMCSSPGVTT